MKKTIIAVVMIFGMFIAGFVTAKINRETSAEKPEVVVTIEKYVCVEDNPAMQRKNAIIDKYVEIINLDSEAFNLTGELVGGNRMSYLLLDPVYAEHELSIYSNKMTELGNKKKAILEEINKL